MNIKAALQQRAKDLNIALPKLLQHYAMERFLYRLSLSPVADRFYLKGGMLLMGVGAGTARTTMDIDLLGRISNSPESIQKAISSIIHTKPGIADGVSFSDNLEVTEITKDALYVGLRRAINILLELAGAGNRGYIIDTSYRLDNLAHISIQLIGFDGVNNRFIASTLDNGHQISLFDASDSVRRQLTLLTSHRDGFDSVFLRNTIDRRFIGLTGSLIFAISQRSNSSGSIPFHHKRAIIGGSSLHQALRYPRGNT